MSAASDRSIYVVYAAAARQETGSQLAHQIVAIQEDPEAAEKLAARYAAMSEGADQVTMRVFTQRYALPYALPALRDLIEKG